MGRSEGLVLKTTKETTRRLTDLAAVDLLHRHFREAVQEVDEAITMIKDRMVEDGECIVTITVTQKMKPKPRCDEWCDSQTGRHSHG